MRWGWSRRQEAKQFADALYAFEQRTQIQFVVAVLPDHGGELQDFTSRLYEHWRIGQRDTQRGVLFVVFPDRRETRIETGYGLEETLPDVVASRILRDMVDVPREPAAGRLAFVVRSVVAAIAPDDPLAAGGGAAATREGGKRSRGFPLPLFFLLFILLPIILGGRRRSSMLGPLIIGSMLGGGGRGGGWRLGRRWRWRRRVFRRRRLLGRRRRERRLVTMPNRNDVPRKFFSADEQLRLRDAIAAAEKRTSGEIRLHLERDVPTKAPANGDAYLRAREVFAGLKMHETADRNGVLVYLATRTRKFAVLGDEKLHERVGEAFWNDIRDLMAAHFREDRFVEGTGRGHRAGRRAAAGELPAP
jgi:uncharacterized membrane protein YgcG